MTAETSSGGWVDFKAVKTAVSMLAVLEHYGIAGTLKKKGDELRGRCPLHDGDGDNTFHASLSKNAFNCFSCKARGNVLDFVAAKEKCNVRDAALKLAAWFGVGSGSPAVKSTEQVVAASVPKTEQDGEAEEDNKPLKFELQGIQFNHPYLKERGIDDTIDDFTARHFGVGFFPGKGSMAGRVVIPIHDHQGTLVGYAGRSIDGSEPKYKFPAGFKKSRVVYGLYQTQDWDESLAGCGQVLVVVEGFFDVINLHQNGFGAVALMGSTMSKRQAELIGECWKGGDVVLMLDGDEAGRRGTREAATLLVEQGNVWVRSVRLDEGQQPDSMTAEELREALNHLMP